jgi:pimeloyl-ACP methyl ester carboxylesterase
MTAAGGAPGRDFSLTNLDARGMGRRKGTARSRMLRWALIAVAAVVLLALVAVVGFYALKAQTAGAQRIATANGVDEAAFAPIGGQAQWVTIRGWDRNNPVLLVVPDAPGQSTTAFVNRYQALESQFTVVQWDPQGAGRTLARNGAPTAISAAGEARDAAAVLAYAMARTGQHRAAVLSGGFGATVALRLSRERPDLVSALALIGPWTAPRAVRDQALFAQMRQFAVDASDPVAGGDLDRLGPPPWTTAERRTMADRVIAGMMDEDAARPDEIQHTLLVAPQWGPGDISAYYAGVRDGPGRLAAAPEDAADFAPAAGAPALIIQPTRDSGAPTALTEAWFARLAAPQKVYLPIRRAGHSIVTSQNDTLMTMLTRMVRPWAVAPAPVAATTR